MGNPGERGGEIGLGKKELSGERFEGYQEEESQLVDVGLRQWAVGLGNWGMKMPFTELG